MRAYIVIVALVATMFAGLLRSAAEAQTVPAVLPTPLITGTVPTSATIALLNVTRDAPAAEVNASRFCQNSGSGRRVASLL